jgi:peptidoglycan/LPS O-acetylase OafA/YrhL
MAVTPSRIAPDGNGSVRRAAGVIFHFSMIAPPVLALRSGLHLGYLDSLRGLSALYVAACHAYLMYATDFASMGVRSASGALLVGTSWVMFGRAAVAVFIVLSGYCLMLPIVRSPGQEWRVAFWPFMRRRAWRILPPYYGALACSAALIVLVPALDDPSIREWHKSFPAFGTGSVVSHLLLVHNYFPAYQYAIDHPLWSIATEWQIYFLFPLLLWIGKRRGDFSIVVTAGAITMALNLYLLNFSPQHNPWPPQFVGLFGFGMACAAWSFPNGSSAPLDAQRWRRQAIVLLVAGAVASVVFISTRQQQLPDLLIGGGIGCAMVFLTNAVLTGSRPVALRVLERPSLVALGRFSYSLYLLHAPLLALFYLLARYLNLTPLALQLFILGVGLPITVAVCYVFHLVFERPFIRRRDAMSSSIAGSGISERVTVA